MQKRLFIPGPVNVREDVLEQMTRPLMGHRTKDASDLQRGISRKLQKIFYTKNQIILSTSSGTAMMEGAIDHLPRRGQQYFPMASSEPFGMRWP